MSSKYQFVVTVLLISNIAIAEGNEERYEDKGNQYFDKTLQKWFYKVFAGGNGYFYINEEKYVQIACPSNSNPVVLYDGIRKACECENGYTPSLKSRHCVAARLRLGQSCDTSNPCSVQAGLECQSGICQCSQDAVWNGQDALCYSRRLCENRDFGTMFDPSLKKCTRVIQSPCDPNKTEAETGCPKDSSCTTVARDEDTRSAWDDPRLGSTCMCNKGLVQVTETTCHKAANLGESCADENVTCSAGLECINNGTICGCSPHLIYDPVTDFCVRGAGTSCPNSFPSCVRNSKCDDKTCKCNRGFTKTERNFCLGEHLSTCDTGADCEAGLECIEGTCNCPAPVNQIYLEGIRWNAQGCRNLVDSTCSSNSTCLPNSECIQGICKCAAGYSKAVNRHCMKSHQQQCKPDQCNPTEGLACINGTCQCIDPGLNFMNNGSGCLGKSGSACGDLQAGVNCGKGKICKTYSVGCEPPTHCNPKGQCELAQ